MNEQQIEAILQNATDNREGNILGNNVNGYGFFLEAMKADLKNEFGGDWNCLWINLDCSMEGSREFSGNLGFGFMLEDNDMKLYCWNRQRSYAE